MKNYTVDVYTGDKWGAGTDANVFCTIFGDKGDSGERELSRSETHGNKFERKQKDRFTIESADLGNVFKMKIRHDNKGGGADWYLDRVEVIDDVRTFVFHCENWLGKKEGDGKIERTLYEKVIRLEMYCFFILIFSVFVFLFFRIIKDREVVWVLFDDPLVVRC